MRSRFALALAAALAAVPAAVAFERQEIAPGDTVLGTLLVARKFNEYTIDTARGSVLTLSISKAGSGSYVPALGVYDDHYGGIGLVQTGPTSVSGILPGSGRHRVLVGSQGTSVGGYRLKTAVRPATKFAMTATADAPLSVMTFGAYAGYEATITLKWKGPAPVTLVSVTGPGGEELTSAATPRTTKSTFRQGGYVATAVGDHVVTVDAPAGTLKWSATVQLTGRLPRGATRDFRPTAPPAQPTVEFPAPGRSPIVTVAGESGGPNEIVFFASGTVPDAAFLDGGAGSGGCSRAPRGSGVPPTKYLLYCTNGFFADVVDVVRDGAGLVTAYDAPSVRTPSGSGSASLSDIAYDAQGHPTGWTEVRRFDSSGRAHELVFSRTEYFPSGACKAFRVVHRLLPDGPPTAYDYAPFR